MLPIVVICGGAYLLYKGINKQTREKLIKNLEDLQDKLNNLETQFQKVLSTMEEIELSPSNEDKNKLNRARKALENDFKNFMSGKKSVHKSWSAIEQQCSKMIKNQKNANLEIQGIETLSNQSRKYQELDTTFKIISRQVNEVVGRLKSAEDYLAQRFNVEDLSELKDLDREITNKLAILREKVQYFYESIKSNFVKS